jgi:hypothetical protein
MSELEFVTYEVAAETKKHLSDQTTLVSGNKFKMELGDRELDVDIPEGEEWDVSVDIGVSVKKG